MRQWFITNPWLPNSSLGAVPRSFCFSNRETGVSRNGFPSRSLGTRGWSKQQGMTLLELTVVLMILTTLATVALRSTSGLQDQARWEQTKNRYEAIKASIIGDPELNINGQPDISGFVADMGRLPLNIKELLSQNYCDNDYQETVPGNCGGNWKINDDYFVGCSDGVSADQATCEAIPGEAWHEILMGWNGPYLLSSESSTDEDAFVDGWGNLPAAVTDLDYGWSFTPDADPATNIILNSVGCATCDTPYDAPYPANNPGIGVNDWQLDLSGSGISVILEPNYSGSCTVDEYTSAGACEIAGATWTGMCTDGSSSNRWMCWGNGETWVHNGCTDLVSTTKTACESSSVTTPPPPPPSSNHIWVTPCSDNTYSTKETCEGASQDWACEGPVNPDSKLLCEGVGGTWTYDTQDIDITITYRNGSGGVSTAVDTATIIENGSIQKVNFSFSGSVIPMGVNNFLISNTLTGDIYPSSCKGLEGDVGGNGFDDCNDAGGTLLSNDLCDDITYAECLAGADGATGTLIRNTQVPFIPHQNLATVNW